MSEKPTRFTGNDGLNEYENVVSQDMFESDASLDDVENDDLQDQQWRGANVEDLGANTTLRFNLEPKEKQHKICVLVHDWTKPFPQKMRDKWDDRHVRMPCSPASEFPVLSDDGEKEIKPRWPLVVKALGQNMESVRNLVGSILAYNLEGRWDFSGIEDFFENHLDPDTESDAFFAQILPQMCRLALGLPRILTSPILLLKRRSNCSLTLSQLQISSLLANAFFCTFPKRNSPGRKTEYGNFPSINFNSLFNASTEENRPEKLKCIMNYFQKRVRDRCGQSVVTFTRRFIPDNEMPAWPASEKKLPKLRVTSLGTIEDDGKGMLQVDFANSFVGGGVLGHGCVQEEIRFLICPELIVARLFTEQLGDNEVLVVSGFERYSNYTGYASSFRFGGEHEDTKNMKANRFPSILVAMDALHFSHAALRQYKDANIVRELNKAYVGFRPNEQEEILSCIATGNWGCGAFRGDPQLKFLIQLMAASENNRDVLYLTFGDEILRDEIFDIYRCLKDRDVTVGYLFTVITSYWRNAVSDDHVVCPLFKFIKRFVLGDYEPDYDADTDEEENMATSEAEKNANDVDENLATSEAEKIDDDVDENSKEARVEGGDEKSVENLPPDEEMAPKATEEEIPQNPEEPSKKAKHMRQSKINDHFSKS